MGKKMDTCLAIPRNNIRICANGNDLDAIRDSVRTGIDGTGHMPERAKRWYFFFAALVAKGFERIEAPLAKIAQAQYHACGQAKSLSTARRAIAELEKLGYVSRRRFRPRSVSVIHFNLENFKFYINKFGKDINPPVGTFQHYYPPQSDCDPDEVTNLDPRQDPSYPKVGTTSRLITKTRGTEANEAKNYDKWRHPLVYSIGSVCFDRGKLTRVKMESACQKAIHENIEPFSYWTPERFKEMPIALREKTARAMLPELEAFIKRRESPSPCRKESPPPKQPLGNPPPPVELPDIYVEDVIDLSKYGELRDPWE